MKVMIALKKFLIKECFIDRVAGLCMVRVIGRNVMIAVLIGANLRKASPENSHTVNYLNEFICQCTIQMYVLFNIGLTMTVI